MGMEVEMISREVRVEDTVVEMIKVTTAITVIKETMEMPMDEVRIPGKAVDWEEAEEMEAVIPRMTEAVAEKTRRLRAVQPIGPE